MRYAGIEELARRWVADPAFRHAAERDLVGAIRRSEIALSEAEWALLRRAGDLLVADDELIAPAAPGGPAGWALPALPC